MNRMQKKLQNQLTNEHERVDLNLKEKVNQSLAHIYILILGIRIKKDQEKSLINRCKIISSAALAG